MAGCFGDSAHDKYMENQALNQSPDFDKCDFCRNEAQYCQGDFWGSEKYYCIDCYGELPMKTNKKNKPIVAKVSEKRFKEIEKAAKKYFDGNISELVRRGIDLMLSKGRNDAGIDIKSR